MKQKYLKSLWWIIKLQWKTSRFYFAWEIFNSVVNGLRPIAQAYALAKLLSSVSIAALHQADARVVYFWLTALLLIELISQTINSFDKVARNRFQQKVDIVTNEQYFLKMYELSQEQFDDEQFNTKLDRAREGLSQIWRVLNEISWAVSALIGFVGSIVVIVVVSPVIGILIIATVIPIALIQVKQNTLREEVYKKIEPLDRVAYRSRWILTDPVNMLEVRLMNAFKDLIKFWRINITKSHDLVHENDKRLAKMDILAEMAQPIIGFGANIYFFRLLLMGTIGFDRFIFLRGMLEQASSSAVQLANSAQRLHELSISLYNFSEVFNNPPLIPNGQVAVDRPLTIEFKDVSFSYPGTDKLVLDKVSFVIAPGSKLALVGENGAGKTTLLKLLLRQYLPTEGKITVNGIDIRDVEQESYYSAISNLSQDYFIVHHLSIKDNLTLGLESEPSDDKIYQALDLVEATEFIKKLPHRLNTRLDTSFNNGTNLSGGQKQRLGVARVLLRSGDVMILDEPTSAIDAKAEFTIFNNIYKSHSGKTTLIVSHRFSTVRKADRIIVMDQGKIIEYGSHEELLEYAGLYKEMFEAQAEGYK